MADDASAAMSVPISRVSSAPSAVEERAQSGFCSKPGHSNFEESQFCVDCDAKYCIRCTGLHIGHHTMDAAQAQFFRRSTSVPSKLQISPAPARSAFDDQMAQFRRTSSASTEAATRAIALTNRLTRRLSVAIDSSGKTLKSAQSILDEAGAAIAAWFSGLSGKALETAIRKAFERFDADGTSLLDRQEFAQAMHAMGLRLTDEQRTMLFQEYDTDGNGTIDIAEFIHMVKRYLCKPGACQSVDETSSDETGGSSQDHTLYKQRWFAHDTAWDPSAIEIQRWARTGLARKQHDVALATQQQQDLQRQQVDKEARFTELSLTVQELFTSLPNLCKLPAHVRTLLSKNVLWHSFVEGDSIVTEGGAADSMFILVGGTAKVVRGLECKEVMSFKSGSFFGENSLSQTGETRHSSVLATGNVTCIEIPRDVYQQCLNGGGPAIDEGSGGSLLNSDGQGGSSPDGSGSRLERPGSAADLVNASIHESQKDDASVDLPEPSYQKLQNRRPSIGGRNMANVRSSQFKDAICMSQSCLAVEPSTTENASSAIDSTHQFDSVAPAVPNLRLKLKQQSLEWAEQDGLNRSFSGGKHGSPGDTAPTASSSASMLPLEGKQGKQRDTANTSARVWRSNESAQSLANARGDRGRRRSDPSDDGAFSRALSCPDEPNAPDVRLRLPPVGQRKNLDLFVGMRANVSVHTKRPTDAPAMSTKNLDNTLSGWGRQGDLSSRSTSWTKTSRDKNGDRNVWGIANAMLDQAEKIKNGLTQEQTGEPVRSVAGASARYSSTVAKDLPRPSTSSRAKQFFGKVKPLPTGPQEFRRVISAGSTSLSRMPSGRFPVRKAFVVEQVDLRG